MQTDRDALETEVVRAGDLAVGDLVLRVGLTGRGTREGLEPEWREVAAVETLEADVLRVEFAGDAPRRYLAGSTFSRRVEL